MSDFTSIAVAALCGGVFALGIAVGRASMTMPSFPRLPPAAPPSTPLPLALRLVDKHRADHKRRWSRIRIARWLRRWGRS